MRLFSVFNPGKNGAKTLIVLLCLLHVTVCSSFFLGPARPGFLLLGLRISPNFDRRVVENIRDDSFYFQQI